MAQEPVRIVIDARGTGRAIRRASGLAAGIFGLIVLIVAAAVAAAGFGIFKLNQSLPAGIARLPIPGLQPVTVASLKDLHAAGRKPLDAAPPAGAYARIDPVAQIAWARAIATAWRADARLDRIDADRIRPDGTVNATDADAQVLYRFLSPVCVAAWWKAADANPSAPAECELWVLVQDGRPFVQLITSRPSPSADGAPPGPEVLTLAATMERARARIPARPFYRGYLIHSTGEGWVWYLSSLSGRDSIPRVRARDGRVWPFSGGAPAAATRRPPGVAPKGYSR